VHFIMPSCLECISRSSQVDLALGLVSKKIKIPSRVGLSIPGKEQSKENHRRAVAWRNQSVVRACASLVRCCIVFCNDAGILSTDSLHTGNRIHLLSLWRWSLQVGVNVFTSGVGCCRDSKSR
jgi:hypothetical protein